MTGSSFIGKSCYVRANHSKIHIHDVLYYSVVPGFLVQTGDRTGTGGGGESFYGEPFADEIHPRLRFAHRGIVAMANNGEKDTNDSQFIITLGMLFKLNVVAINLHRCLPDRADELHGKHTLFGRVVGNTVFSGWKHSAFLPIISKYIALRCVKNWRDGYVAC